MENKAAAIVLAAGYSSRMGSFKPLLPLGGISVLEHVLLTLKEAGIDPIVTVTGHQSEKLGPLISKYGVKECFNPLFSQGMFSSIQAGAVCLKNKRSSYKGFFLVPVDCPLISPKIYKAMLEQKEHYADKMIVPCYRGKKGHPLYLPNNYLGRIFAGDANKGMKQITDKKREDMIHLEVPEETVVMDMDTPEDYRELEDYLKMGGRRLPSIKRKLILIRHGQIKQHKEPILLGQADVPLSNKGMVQAKKAGEIIRTLHGGVRVIYTSDLKRAYDTAKIISEVQMENSCGINIVTVKEFREMSLGQLDGMYVSEFKNKFPDEYEYRGKNLLKYKIGNKSENFYDLQYRVMKKLNQLAVLTPNDICIVTHAGVIKVILSNLLGIPLQEAADMKIDNGEVTALVWDPSDRSCLL